MYHMTNRLFVMLNNLKYYKILDYNKTQIHNNNLYILQGDKDLALNKSLYVLTKLI